ncbi:hypothetical protein M9Y10_025796 [Tritrichomonas musculus]|uniref:Uncharacterized protein n=1 Tax=Tritrichomonas musculus TaxID=1915356 RepID=A0ABR2HC23_9EUKA
MVFSGDVVLNAGKDNPNGKSAKNRKIHKIEKNKVTITKFGDYWNENKKPKIVINADSKRYDIDTKYIDNFAKISSNPTYSFGDKVEGDEENSVNNRNGNNENTNDKPKDDEKKLSTGAIIGIVVGCVAFVAIVIVVIVVVVNKKKESWM